MMRIFGKGLRLLWATLIVCAWVVADIRGDLDGTWMDDFGNWASLLLFAWLICFAIGVSRGEPNPE